MSPLLRLFHTVRHLKPRQFGWRGYYLIRKRLGRRGLPPLGTFQDAGEISIAVRPVAAPRCCCGDSFTFLNKAHDFSGKIDWNFPGYGKLWSYNLNYFAFLNQQEMDAEQGMALIRDFLSELPKRSEGLEPYPTSLRIINWVKFLSLHRIRDRRIEEGLYRQSLHLLHNLEYHLLGNHLLENAFALLFAAAVFPDGPFARKAEEILVAELNEQILADGAHFELSPMYHQIILERLLDAVNLLQSAAVLPRLLPFLRDKASLMLGWLEKISFADGTIPLVNDAAFGIAPTNPELFGYAARLEVPVAPVSLGASGYRKLSESGYEMLVDVGQIGPDYIPGHAHSDTFNFVLHVGGRPLIVDTGVSTYETSQRRLLERGTAAHNTVQIAGLDQSEVWGSFRVARRARVHDLEERPGTVSAWHDGYRRIGARHRRTFATSPDVIEIMDDVEAGNGDAFPAKAFLHFHPEVELRVEGEKLVADGAVISFTGADGISLLEYEYAPEFNKLVPARAVEISFRHRLITTLIINR